MTKRECAIVMAFTDAEIKNAAKDDFIALCKNAKEE